MKNNPIGMPLVVEVNVGSDLNPEIQSALIADFPKDFGKDIFTTADGGTQTVTSNNKTDQSKRFVLWGKDNRLPLEVVKRAYLSPYVAPSLNHIVNSLFSSGLKPYYVYYIVENGKVKREQIDYEAAGVWLKERIRILSDEIKAPPVNAAFGETRPPVPDHKEEIARLEKDYKTWEETWKKLKEFLQNNNIPKWLLEVSSDLAYFWNWFPTLDLNIGLPDQDWIPEIVGISHLEATCTRKGVMNTFGEIPYCVYSRSFGEPADATINTEDIGEYEKQRVIPALDPDYAVKQLREKVAKQRANVVARRTTRYVLPMRMPTPGKPYYAMPTWYSIFKSGIYYYLLAMLNQRATRLKNGTMFSRIIHLNEAYVRYMCEQADATGDPDKELEVYNKLVDSLKQWFQNPDNNGKPLLAMTKTVENKTVNWVSVEVVEPPKGDANLKDDIAEIANVILYAMGIHPQTVGALPGKDKVASGSEARELNTLQQLDMFAQKVMLMYPFYIIKAFNKWDEKLYFDIPLHVLTTLDKNKRGVEEMSNNV